MEFPPFEEPCTNPDCYGKKSVKEKAKIDKSSARYSAKFCGTCNNTGEILTSFGEAVLALVEKHFEVDVTQVPSHDLLSRRRIRSKW